MKIMQLVEVKDSTKDTLSAIVVSEVRGSWIDVVFLGGPRYFNLPRTTRSSVYLPNVIPLTDDFVMRVGKHHATQIAEINASLQIPE